ncbi:RNA-binding protein Cwf29 [Tieghemiomyces parasiticus]|uniref:RNA-binding protein Cwf29 n=1 Tax=Tieghemiomyces parasiticus TaxID=78921 RepID=A0A9W8ACK7_9FUNG|nr:RNA-binding protein Cwf29 [Tieghemiomyces parasiticus]
MNVVKEIQRINRAEARRNPSSTGSGSWHDAYRDSAYIFIGGLDSELTEGDIICVFSQYGEILDVNLVRDKETGRSRGYAFLMYDDQRSTVLAVDNLNGTKVAGRTLRVDHVMNYRPPKDVADRQGDNGLDDAPQGPTMNAAPPLLDDSDAENTDAENERLLAEHGLDPEDPMAEYYLKKIKKKLRKEKKEKKAKKAEKSRKRAKDRSAVTEEPADDESAKSRRPDDSASKPFPADPLPPVVVAPPPHTNDAEPRQTNRRQSPVPGPSHSDRRSEPWSPSSRYPSSSKPRSRSRRRSPSPRYSSSRTWRSPSRRRPPSRSRSRDRYHARRDDRHTRGRSSSRDRYSSHRDRRYHR